MDKALRLLGLAMKAGKVVYGSDSIGQKLTQCRTLFLASDAGSSTLRNALHLSEKHGIPIVKLTYDKSTLGHSIGKSICAFVGVMDKGLSDAISEALASASKDTQADIQAETQKMD